MVKVGLIANPASGKDIRRLVAHGTVFDNQEKVNIVRRILLGLAAVGVEQVVYMPDYYGIAQKALDGLSGGMSLPLDMVAADITLTGTQIDSCNAAQFMQDTGVGCIITMGGDGTNRMVAKGCGQTPLLPISTGTNNVFPRMVEGTIAGLAAGVVARGLVTEPPAVYTTKKIVVYRNEEPVDIALIDAVVLDDIFIGSRAVWDAQRIKQVVVSRGEAHNIGISSIAGNLDPVTVEDKRGMSIEFDRNGMPVLAPIAPGLIVPVRVKSYQSIALEEQVAVGQNPCVIALDGEREVEIKTGETAHFKLTASGPRVVDVEKTLRAAVAKGYTKGEEAARHLIWLEEEM